MDISSYYFLFFNGFCLSMLCTALQIRYWEMVTQTPSGPFQSMALFTTPTVTNCCTLCSVHVTSSTLLTFSLTDGGCSCFTEGDGTTITITSSANKRVYYRPMILELAEAGMLYLPETKWKLYLSTTKVTRDAAYAGCQEKQGRLAIIETAEKHTDMQFVRVKFTAAHAHINGRLLGTGQYGWYEYPNVTFPDAYWYPGQPASNLPCVFYLYDGSRKLWGFDDVYCSFTSIYLCEIP